MKYQLLTDWVRCFPLWRSECFSLGRVLVKRKHKSSTQRLNQFFGVKVLFLCHILFCLRTCWGRVIFIRFRLRNMCSFVNLNCSMIVKWLLRCFKSRDVPETYNDQMSDCSCESYGNRAALVELCNDIQSALLGLCYQI